MSLSNLLDLYDLEARTVLFKHVESNELLAFANNIEKYRLAIQNRYDNDEHLLEVLGLLKKVFFKLTGSFLPYNRVTNEDLEQQLLKKFFQIKNSYPELFNNIITPIAKSFKSVIEVTSNYLHNYLCENINSKAEVGMKVVIVTKRAIAIEEIMLITNGVKSQLKIYYFTENSFRKSLEVFDKVIYIGNPNYFGEFVTNTFKGKTTTFIAYDVFTNSMTPKKVFEDLGENGAYSTIFEKITFGEPIEKKSNLNLERGESLNTAVSKFLEEQKAVGGNFHDAVEACIVYLENERFLFAPKDSKIRVFTPQENTNFIKQINFKDVDVDEYIIIRNDRDTKLIAEVADHDVLKLKANRYRELQNDWKERLRFNVKKKGLKLVSDILTNKYHIKTASLASVRSWCNEESICPIELPKLLNVLKYDENKIRETNETMKEIQLAHRKAGRIISEKLMNELSKDILNELQEKGYYTFESKEFNGASFNIERIVSIDQSRHLIAPYNLMKPMDID
jgi:hypothetical protein